ncbi:MAG: class I SAM-dependent methyltransferase [Chloroflexota bacterium]
MTALVGDYYIACQETFRASTNQANLMVAEFSAYCQDKQSVRILSVGSGIGLFELPMLRALQHSQLGVSKFVGLDIDPKASKVLAEKLNAEFGNHLDFEVFAEPYQEFSIAKKFDIILFNHVFEYLQADHLKWIKKSMSLLANDGHILIFSPLSGGINKYYADLMPQVNGFAPFFAADIERILGAEKIGFSNQTIMGACDISLLSGNNQEDKVKLLSFMTQMDCRAIAQEKQADYIAYYTSLAEQDQDKIPHPTSFFII